MKKTLWGLLFIAASGCSAGEDSIDIQAMYGGYVSELVSVADLMATSSGEAVVDLRVQGVGYDVDHGLDISEVSLICPNDQVMNFREWIGVQSAESGIDYMELEDGFVVFRGKEALGYKPMTAAPPSDCPAGCRACTDGGCICD